MAAFVAAAAEDIELEILPIYREEECRTEMASRQGCVGVLSDQGLAAPSMLRIVPGQLKKPDKTFFDIQIC